MEPSLRSYEMRNIEKNMEGVNQKAIPPKYFDQSSAFKSHQPVESMNRNNPMGRFPYGGSAGPTDPKLAGQYNHDRVMNPELSNYPCKGL